MKECCENCLFSHPIYTINNEGWKYLKHWYFCEILKSPHEQDDYCKNFKKEDLPF